MDDNWELLRGLDPSDPSDYAGDYCGKGYMNVEYYINDLTVNSFPEGVVELSPESGAPLPTVSAFETIEAESLDAQEGIRIEDNEEYSNIAYIENGDWAMYQRVDFGSGAQSFSAKVAGNASAMELYIDSLSGEPEASISFGGSSGFTDYKDIEVNIPKISGTHDLFIKFTGGEGYLVNLDSFVFGKDKLPLSGKLFNDVQVTDQAFPDK